MFVVPYRTEEVRGDDNIYGLVEREEEEEELYKNYFVFTLPSNNLASVLACNCEGD